jgi:hypothetical protein
VWKNERKKGKMRKGDEEAGKTDVVKKNEEHEKTNTTPKTQHNPTRKPIQLKRDPLHSIPNAK